MELVRLAKRNRDGSLGTQINRQRGLTAIAADLKSLGFELKGARSLKPKHVEALVEMWRDAGIAKASMRNRMSWLRWWAQKIDKVSVIHKDNARYEINEDDDHQHNQAFSLTKEQLQAIRDSHIRVSVMMQAAFGLRREEAMKFTPREAILKDCIRLKGSWTKGGRPRTIPITSQHQRLILDAARTVAKNGSLIPSERSYAEHLRLYERSLMKAGIRRAHGLRHRYAQARYEKLTGMKCPLNGGPDRSMMTDEQYELDRQARARISKELGHSRIEITDVYLGRILPGRVAA